MMNDENTKDTISEMKEDALETINENTVTVEDLLKMKEAMEEASICEGNAQSTHQEFVSPVDLPELLFKDFVKMCEEEGIETALAFESDVLEDLDEHQKKALSEMVQEYLKNL